MQLVLIPGLLLALLAGCVVDKPVGDTGDETGDDTNPDAGADDLPALAPDGDTTGCEGMEDSDGTWHDIPGAAGYFYGLYERSGEGWVGEEAWLLFANPAWVELGEDDCEIWYAASAAEGDKGACPSCDLAIEVSLTVDATLSTCPEALYEGTSGTVTYALRYSSDTEVDWYFASSGDPLGSGYYNESAMNFLSERQCEWF